MITVERVSSAVLDPTRGLVRGMPRPLEYRQPGYEAQYDRTTLFCDAFFIGSEIVLSGPPLLNLAESMDSVRFRVNGLPGVDASLSDLWKTQRSRLTWRCSSLPVRVVRKVARTVKKQQTVSFALEGQRFTLPVNPDGAHRFAGKKVLFTLQKANRLEWIREWITFYRKYHGVDAVVIYDNNSPDYSPEQIADVIRSVEGIDEGCVVPWNFPYGPGSPRDDTWDSDFCQYTALEHMRWRFTRRANAVINADIDELVICDDGRSVVDHLRDSGAGVVNYQCAWIEAVSPREIGAERSFVDFVYRSKTRQLGTKKWTVEPRKMPVESQFCVHRIADGPPMKVHPGILHRHFFAMNTDWKRDRATVRPVDPEIHYIDEKLAEALSAVFGLHRDNLDTAGNIVE